MAVPAPAPAAPGQSPQPQEASPTKAAAVVGDDATRAMMGLSLKAEVAEGAAAAHKAKKAGLFDDIESDGEDGAFI